jgi:RNA polymerase sigma-70 factor (ECF subfamily)
VADSTDAELVVGSHADPNLFGTIFERNYAPVHRYLRRRLGADDADELASETFARAFRSRGRYDATSGEPRAWLFGIATNLLRQHWRRETREFRAYARACFAAVEAGTEAVDDRVDAQRMNGNLAEALAALSRPDRDVLLLHAWADLSHAEIATALGIPAGTVRSRLSRARKTVRERIGPIGEDTYDESLEEEPHSGRSRSSP